MITHIMPSAMSTNLASPMMSNCEIVSANVEPPKDNGDPGMILGVGLGVGRGVGVAVGVVVGSAGGGDDVGLGSEGMFVGGGGGGVGDVTGIGVG